MNTKPNINFINLCKGRKMNGQNIAFGKIIIMDNVK
jgi:hypothetical protein